MKIWLSLFLLSILSVTANAQERQRKNNIYLEAGGPAIPYNIGYERVLKVDESGDIRLKGGVGITTTCYFCDIDDMVGGFRVTEINSSLELLRLKGKKKGRFEYGGGVGITNYRTVSPTFLLSGRIGYRFISINNGLNFGIGLNPTIRISDNHNIPYPFRRPRNTFAPYPGLKLGYGF